VKIKIFFHKKKTMSRFNAWKENILSIQHGSVYTEFVRNVFNELGTINRMTILNSELVVEIDVRQLDTEIIQFIMKFKGISCKLRHNHLHRKTIVYKDHNALDFLSAVYDSTSDARNRNADLYKQYLEWLFNPSGENKTSLPTCKVIKTSEFAVVPSKSRMSDVGYDLTAISKVKDINSTTVMLETGIIVSPQLNYYSKIYPRSSLVKSGYMLANSVGIIDATYRDTLKICLVKVDPHAPEIVFPFKCCQLIFEKQVHVDMEECALEDLTQTSRDVGGFGSTDNMIVHHHTVA